MTTMSELTLVCLEKMNVSLVIGNADDTDVITGVVCGFGLHL